MPSSTRRRKASRCSFPNCKKQLQTRRLCKAHGCTKLAQSRGLCVAHGGGRRCTFDGCSKLAQYKKLCLSHGGGRRCCVEGCAKFVQLRGCCKAHLKYMKETTEATTYRTATHNPSDSFDPVPTTTLSKLAIAFLMNPSTNASDPSSKRPSTTNTYSAEFDGQIFSIP
ncbi:hypothetical protein JG687_00017831 [Phytophthora cactorum]|uniref:WRKY19-like zinc finger domain-containing protein n=1 Tax=Phytophthora cactorum TaxID=29920 RepID=A0A8T1TS77_9STRA|nr:hypothetical protein JG687_00017831 [Phytophthora cactorum]